MKSTSIVYCQKLLQNKLQLPKKYSDLITVTSNYSPTDFLIWVVTDPKTKHINAGLSLAGHLFLDPEYYKLDSITIHEDGFGVDLLKKIYDPSLKRYIDPYHEDEKQRVKRHSFKLPFLNIMSQIRSEYKYYYQLKEIPNYKIGITSANPTLLDGFLNDHKLPHRLQDRYNAGWWYETFMHYLILREFSGSKLIQLLDQKSQANKRNDWENANILGFLGYFDKECKFYPVSGYNKYDNCMYEKTPENLMQAYKKALTSVIFYDYNSEYGLQAIAHKIGCKSGITDLHKSVDAVAYELAKFIYEGTEKFKYINHFHSGAFFSEVSKKRKLYDNELYLFNKGMSTISKIVDALLNESDLFKKYYENTSNVIQTLNNLLYSISIRSYHEFIILYDFELSDKLNTNVLGGSIHEFRHTVSYERGVYLYMNQCILEKNGMLPIFTEYDQHIRYFPIVKILATNTINKFLEELKTKGLLENTIKAKNELIYYFLELYKCFKGDSEYASRKISSPEIFKYIQHISKNWATNTKYGVYTIYNFNCFDQEKGLKIEIDHKIQYLPFNKNTIKIEKYPNLQLTNLLINKQYISVLYNFLNNDLVCDLSIY